MNAESALGAFRPKLAANLERALGRLDDARGRCADDDLKKTRKRLQQTRTALGQYVHRLGGRAARKKLDETLRLSFRDRGEAIASDVQTLRGALACPAGAST